MLHQVHSGSGDREDDERMFLYNFGVLVSITPRGTVVLYNLIVLLFWKLVMKTMTVLLGRIRRADELIYFHFYFAEPSWLFRNRFFFVFPNVKMLIANLNKKMNKDN